MRDRQARLPELLIPASCLEVLQIAVLYEKDIIAGTHTLHSNMTTLQVLDELSTPMERLNDH